MKTKKFISLILLTTSSLFAAPFDNLIVFGDSLSDAASLSKNLKPVAAKNKGNNYWVEVEGKIGAPISSLNPVTRNVALWPNYLVINTTLFSPNPNQTRYIYPSSHAASLGFSPRRYNTNYAWASAETGPHYVNDILSKRLGSGYYYNDTSCKKHGPGLINEKNSCVPGVLLQVKSYLDDVHQHPNPDSLIILWGGANDIFNNIERISRKDSHDNKLISLFKLLFSAYPIGGIPATEELSNPVKNLKQAVILLIQAGVPAQNIYVINLPNLSHTPSALSKAHGQKSFLYILSTISEFFNIMLRIQLAFDYLHPSFNLPNSHIISSEKLFQNILNNHQQEGFLYPTKDCVKNKATPYCEGYLFFNNIHPTTKVHQMIAHCVEDTLLPRATR